MNESYKGTLPQVDADAWVHDNAVLIGDVTVNARANVWPGCVLRGDQGAIVIGEETSIQDGTIAHCTGGVSTTVIGARCTVGHRVVLHGRYPGQVGCESPPAHDADHWNQPGPQPRRGSGVGACASF